MASPILVGGSSNVILDLNLGTSFELTGLSNTGAVIQQVNVRIIQSSPLLQSSIAIRLPLIADLNYRNVQFNIDSNNYVGEAVIDAQNGNFINGQQSITVDPTIANAVLVFTVTSSDNYTVNVPII
jgi:hypothetical protein